MSESTALIRFLDELKEKLEVQPARAMATKTFFDANVPDKSRLIAMGTSTNPFFVPEVANEAQAKAMFTADAWCKSIAMGRTVAANTSSLRILVSSAPKSGSTFLAYKLGATFKLPQVGLTLTSALPYGNVVFGGALRDHDIDEMALITAAFSPNGFISHRHMICTPYLGKQLGLYRTQAVITYRNIFDSFVSLDEHMLKTMREQENGYLRTGLPESWSALDFDDRLDILLDLMLGWYMKFYATWARCEEGGHIKPIRISYEQDFLGDKTRLATMLCERLGRPEGDIAPLAEALTEKKANSLNVNVGVTGRGNQITGRNRTRIVDYFHKYRDLADFSELLGGA
jgi:hypothetical protein